MPQQLSQVASNVILPIFLIILNILAWLPSDMNVPLMPLMAVDFSVSTNMIQGTVCIFLLGYCLTPLLHGILSDYWGRRPTILYGLTFTLIGSLLCALTHQVSYLYLGRLLQGVGAAACLSVPRAILRDVYSSYKMSQILSWISISTEISVALAPLISAYAAAAFGWESSFYALGGLTFIMLIIGYYFLPETNANLKKGRWQANDLLREVRTVLTNSQFIVFALTGGLSLAVIMAYFTISPFILQETLHISVTAYGLSTLAVNASILTGVFLNIILLRLLRIKAIMVCGLVIVCLGCVAMLGSAAFIPLRIASVVLPGSIAIIGCGLTFANSSVGALRQFAQSAGTASALYTVLQLAVALIVTSILTISPYDNLLGLGASCLVLGGLTLGAFIVNYSRIKL